MPWALIDERKPSKQRSEGNHSRVGMASEKPWGGNKFDSLKEQKVAIRGEG